MGAMDPESAEYFHLMSETMKLGFADRAKYMGDPNFVHVPVTGLTDKDYAARQAALDILRRELYRDAMAVDNDEIRGGSLTNVAIRAAYGNLNLKCDRFEWQVFGFVQGVLRLAGIETEKIAFVRQDIVNRSEIIADIAAMRGDIDRETALRLNPYLAQEDVEGILGHGG